MPQQIKLNLAEVDVGHPGPTIPPEREQQLIALMAQDNRRGVSTRAGGRP